MAEMTRVGYGHRRNETFGAQIWGHRYDGYGTGYTDMMGMGRGGVYIYDGYWGGYGVWGWVWGMGKGPLLAVVPFSWFILSVLYCSYIVCTVLTLDSRSVVLVLSRHLYGRLIWSLLRPRNGQMRK